jgi:hypothetical protein
MWTPLPNPQAASCESRKSAETDPADMSYPSRSIFHLVANVNLLDKADGLAGWHNVGILARDVEQIHGMRN